MGKRLKGFFASARYKVIGVKDFFNKNPLVALLFIATTSFFIYQHWSGAQWDFQAYSLNAQYLFGNGSYFEWCRPPLPSVLMGLGNFFVLPAGVAEYLYIIFVSALFLYSCLEFARRFRFNQTTFYALMLNPFLILVGLSVGTELLSLSLLMLLISFIFSDRDALKIKSGFVAGLIFLTRYMAAPYSLLIFFSKKARREPQVLFIFFLTIFLATTPWLAYNYVSTGHALTSLADSQAMNVKYRSDYIFQNPSLLDFLVVGNLLIPFFILGVLRTRRDEKFWALAAVFALTTLMYVLVPVKTPRYLFNLVLPFAYFAYFALEDFESKHHIKPSCVFAAFAILSVILFAFQEYSSQDQVLVNGEITPANYGFYDVGLPKDCMISSNEWVPLNYVGYISVPNPRREEIGNYLDKGYQIVIFYNQSEPEYSSNITFLKSFPVIKNGRDYIVLGNSSLCIKSGKVRLNYLEWLNDTSTYVYGEAVETNPCRSLGLGELCKHLNFL